MAKALLPQAFWFRIAASCPRVDEIPRRGARGGLLDLPAPVRFRTWRRWRVASPGPRSGSAGIRRGWGSRSWRTRRPARLPGADRPEGFADVHLWIDTRDTRNVSRATRFCHRFAAHLTLARDRKSLDVEVGQRPIARAVADAPICPARPAEPRAELTRAGWILEVFLPAQVLHGFDPETNRRLGFAYQVSDHDREDQFLGVGRDFPLGENPSLWATLELKP